MGEGGYRAGCRACVCVCVCMCVRGGGFDLLFFDVPGHINGLSCEMCFFIY